MNVFSKKLLAALLSLCMLLIQLGCRNGSAKDKDLGSESVSSSTEEMVEQTEQENEYALASEAFSEINAAHELLDKMVNDIYEAWHWGIYEAKDGQCTLALLAEELKRPVNELKRGYAYVAHINSWADLSVGERQKCINSAESDFKKLLNSGFSRFSACVNTIKGVYLENGSFAGAEEHLEAAGALIQKLHERFPESAICTPLLEYYKNEMAMADYCQSPDGSFEQAKTTINDFRNSARGYGVEIGLLINK